MAFDEEEPTMRMRSIYVSPDESEDGDYDAETEEEESARMRFLYGKNIRESQAQDIGNASHRDEEGISHRRNGGDNEDESIGNHDIKNDEEYEDLDEPEPEALQLPESTHTLFFTQPIFSMPFFFALSIVAISIACLVMALLNNLEDSSPNNILNVPVNVSSNVRWAQYLSIFIVLLMEEEIPTGLHLLRMIPKAAFKERFPNKSYCKFVLAALLRIVMGYIFLANVLVILAQASDVLDIFYDVLALQFIQQLDDMAFGLAKMDVLGKGMLRACTAKLFQTEFEKQQFKRSRGASIFLKSVYFLNLGGLVLGMTLVSTKQMDGYYQCADITVDFGNSVWEDAVVEVEGPPGQFNTQTLVFSYFNGVYEQRGTHENRPRYVEMNKFDRKEFYPGAVIPAEIKYDSDSEAWVFSHSKIGKRKEQIGEWILRSPKTNEYDLMNVEGKWEVWLGAIDSTELTYTCNTCFNDEDCNLNGECREDGSCECFNRDGVEYLGKHCEGKLKDTCRSIIGEQTNTTWSVQEYMEGENGEGPLTLFQEYGRPVYTNVAGIPDLREGDINWLVYTGNRWFAMSFYMDGVNMTLEDLIFGVIVFHGFWSEAYNEVTNFVSDPTTKDTPVGVDWYQIAARGEQYGWLGALQSVQVEGQVGRGHFRCAGEYFPPTDPTPTNSTNTTSTSSINTTSTRKLQFKKSLMANNDYGRGN